MTEQERADNHETILSDFDKKELLESGEIIVRKFLENYPDKLPDAIILPETSAFPLRYLLEPIMVKVCEERGVRMPVFYSLVTHKQGLVDKHTAQSIVEGYTSDITEKKDALLRGGLSEEEWLQTIRELDFKISASRLWHEELDNINLDFDTMRPRVDEISLDLQERGFESPVITVFDEHTNSGKTIKNIRAAFEREIPLYSLTISSNAFGEHLDPIEYGLIHEVTDLGVKTGQKYTGFMYRNAPDRSEFIGSRKKEGKTYSELTPDANPVRMYQFRKELNEIGNQIAEKI